MYTSPENFSAPGSPLAKVMRPPFHPYAGDAWALAVVTAEVRGGLLTRQATCIIPSRMNSACKRLLTCKRA